LTIQRRDGRFDHLNFSLNVDGFFHYSFPLKTYERILLSTSFRDGSVVENLKLKVLTLSPLPQPLYVSVFDCCGEFNFNILKSSLQK